jgi:hypothetical protein
VLSAYRRVGVLLVNSHDVCTKEKKHKAQPGAMGTAPRTCSSVMHGPTIPFIRGSRPAHMIYPLSPYRPFGAPNALLELGYDPSMKGRLLRSATSLAVLRISGAKIRRTAEVLMAAGTAPRVARHGLRLGGKPLAAV